MTKVSVACPFAELLFLLAPAWTASAQQPKPFESITVQAPIDTLPLFVRAGSIKA